MKQKTDTPEFKPTIKTEQPIVAKPIKPEPVKIEPPAAEQCPICKAFDSDKHDLLLTHMNTHTDILKLGQLTNLTTSKDVTTLTFKS